MWVYRVVEESRTDVGEQMNIKHQNGLVEYDTHNLFGLSMSKITRQALLDRRPGLRPFVLSRSTVRCTWFDHAQLY